LSQCDSEDVTFNAYEVWKMTPFSSFLQVFEKYLTFCGVRIQNAQLFEVSILEYKKNQVSARDAIRDKRDEESASTFQLMRVLESSFTPPSHLNEAERGGGHLTPPRARKNDPPGGRKPAPCRRRRSSAFLL